MADVNQQLNGVEWTPVGGEAPAPKKPALPKWLVAGFLGVLGVVLVVALAVFLLQMLKKNGVANGVEQEMAASTFDCESARDVEKCKQSIAPRRAQESGNPAYCKGLVDAALDSCLNAAALTARDEKICADMKDDAARTDCKDAVHALTIASDDSYEACAEFSDAQVQRDCEHAWIRDHILAGDCAYAQISDALCTDGEVYASAINAKNPDLCAPIVDADVRVECVVVVSPGDRDGDGVDADEEESFGTSDSAQDSDGDGLMDGEEIRTHGTDPTVSDTDGDSFSDGVEVQNGFNPLSP